MTIQLTDAQIERGLNELEQFVPTYVWLQEHVRRCDVRTDREFRTTFNGFYRVRQKSAAWYDSYFRLMEKCKERAYTFDEVLRELYLETKEVHASFCSKLVATLDSTKPVIDSVVLGKFGLRLPPYNARDRLARCGVVHRRLCDEYERLVDSPQGRVIRARFTAYYPVETVSELKKIDLVLWKA